ncbi:hypothetical protein FRC01_001361 [Tulasnella sp. 417]|nr:hypothetical protein FRC01_001361 [Tulasnella sp. 417]
MSSTSSAESPEGTSSQSDRDIFFYTNLTFVLEPKEKSSAPSEDALQHVISKLDPHARITKDTRSKNYWLHAITKHKFDKLNKLAQNKADLSGFTIREVRPNSPEEERIRGHIAKWLASTASASHEVPATSRPSGDPPGTAVDRSRQRLSVRRSRQDQSPSGTKADVDKAGPSIPKESFAQDGALPGGMDRSRSTRRRAAPRKGAAAPSYSSTSSEPSGSGPSRGEIACTFSLGKRAAVSPPLSDQNNAPVPDVDGLDNPESPTVERPQKRVRIDLRLNTYKYFTDDDERRTTPSDADTFGGAQLAPTINELPSACLQRILIYGTPCPASNPVKVYRSALYELISVCSKWKAIAESTPSLWSHLSNANPPGMLEACIQRSTSVTIAVHFDGTVEYPSKVQSALEAFLDKVAPHRRRWKSVQLNNVPPTWESYLAVARAFNGPAPRLVSAKVTTIYGGTMPFVESLRFFGGEARALRHITLSGIVPNLSDVPLFMNIESLRIIRPLGVCHCKPYAR